MTQISIQQAMDTATAHHQAGQLAQAEAIYRQILSRQPNHPGAMHLLGLLAFQSGRSDIALELIGRAITLSPNVADCHLNLGVVLSGLGRFPEAIQSFRHALELRPDLPEAFANMGDALRRSGRLAEAADACRQAVVLRPNYAEAHLNLGNALQDAADLDGAIAAFQQAVTLRPDLAEGHFNLGNALAKKGRLDDAIAAHRQALRIKPDFPDGMINLAEALHAKGELDQAIPLLRQALNLHPDSVEAQLGLATLLAARRDWDAAILAYRQAVLLRPELAEAHCGLGEALRAKGDLQNAVAAYHQAIAANPQYAQAYCRLGQTLTHLGQQEKAISAFRRAVFLDPKNAQSHGQLGWALYANGDLDEAMACMNTAIALAPADWVLHNDMGVAWERVGRVDEAIACYDRALAVNPGAVGAASNRVYALLYHPDYDSAALLQEHKLWGRRYAQLLTPSIIVHDNDRSPRRRLRVGYVTGDFRDHPLGRNLMPLLRRHDRRQFEVICYSGVTRPDAMTPLFHAMADGWRDIASLDDQAAADLIRGEKIDILVDLTMHMAGGRLLIFARKPAPVQVTFMGYPGGTGLEAMDWRITDPRLDPPGLAEMDYVERSYRLPDSYWCYEPQAMQWEPDAAHAPPDVAAPPAEKNGYVTFGCLNNFRKVNDGVLKLWGRVMQATPASRLLLLAPAGEARRRVRRQLAESGIHQERIDFVPHQSRPAYLAEFGRIDLCLDTVPYNGHTTSLDAMWMGVPVVTRVGRTVSGRAGLSQLYNLGLTELAADDDDQFVKVAVALAGDPPRRAELRRTLRQRMLDSPLTDAGRFARNVEAAYRHMWRIWRQCGSKPS